MFQQAEFEPVISQRNFRIQTSNYQAQSYIPAIAEAFYQQAPLAQLEIISLEENSLLNQSVTTSDLVLCSEYFKVPTGYHRVRLGHETFSCIMSRSHPLACKQTLTLDDYLACQHVMVKLGGNRQAISDDFLGENRGRRCFGFRTPFFVEALETVGRTNLLFTTTTLLPERFAQQFELISKPLPFELPEPNYFLAWAENVNSDPGLTWLRELCFDVIQKIIPFPSAEASNK